MNNKYKVVFKSGVQCIIYASCMFFDDCTFNVDKEYFGLKKIYFDFVNRRVAEFDIKDIASVTCEEAK